MSDKVRDIKWFVRGTRPDGTRWESTARHPLKEDAENEMHLWGLGEDAGEMKIFREVKIQ